ncbi:MAG: hypothetical protein JRJ24_09925 [Deltaproteobacteria bacterium]|nr:hypothetical protein [Deltaproteobacteria bacterium]
MRAKVRVHVRALLGSMAELRLHGLDGTLLGTGASWASPAYSSFLHHFGQIFFFFFFFRCLHAEELERSLRPVPRKDPICVPNHDEFVGRFDLAVVWRLYEGC